MIGKSKDIWIIMSVFAVAVIGNITNFLFKMVSGTDIIIGTIIYLVLALLVFIAIQAVKLNRIAHILSDLVEIQNKKENLIVTLEYIKSLEGKIRDSEIWVLTCNLSWDIEGEFWKVVKRGVLKRSNTYIYFLPQRQKDRYQILLKKLQMDNERIGSPIKVCYLDNEHDMLVNHLVIYHPNNSNRRQAFMLMPTAEMGLALILDKTKAAELQEKLSRICERGGDSS